MRVKYGCHGEVDLTWESSPRGYDEAWDGKEREGTIRGQGGRGRGNGRETTKSTVPYTMSSS